VLEGLLDAEIQNQIVVPEPTRHWAKVALDRMLTIS
jgi:quinolinate synthase